MTELAYGEPVDVPITIHTKDNGAFRVPDTFAWCWTDKGIQATGHWLASPGREEDVLIPDGEIRHLTFDYKRLQDWYDEAVKNGEIQVEDESPSA